MTLTLHGYWRSGTSYRVRLGLALKGVAYDQATHDLRRGEQREASYRALAPQGLVPTLDTGDAILTQSPAILEWLEERYPDPPLLPEGATDRAVVRAMSALIACDVHPLNNLRVLDTLRADFAADGAQVKAWAARWIGDGFAALEAMVQSHGDGYAFGDRPTLADCHLVPQLYSAERFGVNLAPYPALVAAGDRLRALPQAAAAHPDAQPDADR